MLLRRTAVLVGVTLALCGKESAQAATPLATEIVDTRLGASLTVQAPDRNDQLGSSCLLADLDGDGFDDLVIGSPLADSLGNSRAKAGEVHVIYGRRSLPTQIDLAVDPADSVIFGGPAGDRFGGILATGDLNDDCRLDLVVGATFGHGPNLDRSLAGQVYVFFGGTRFPAEWDVASSPADVTIYGIGSSSSFGSSIAIADLDSDGIAELAIGAPGDVTLGRVGGKVYLFHGRSTWPSEIDLALAPAERMIVGDRGVDNLGWSLATGDIDGDGSLDLAVSAPEPRSSDPGPGVVRIYSHLLGMPPVIDVRAHPGDWIIGGAALRGFLGFGLALTDLDGDGFDDVVVSAHEQGAPGRNRAGVVHGLLGGPLALLRRISDLATGPPAELTLLGATADSRLGRTLGAVYRQGNRTQLAVASPFEHFDSSRSFAGVVRLLSPELGVTDLTSSSVDTAILGPGELAAFGWSIASGDFDNDGGTDIAVGAPLSPSTGSPKEFAGEVFLVRGQPVAATSGVFQQNIVHRRLASPTRPACASSAAVSHWHAGTLVTITTEGAP